MRELWNTGYMHNRVRMIVASFLTKHLLIPWQKGEQWFWDTLVDADLASNGAEAVESVARQTYDVVLMDVQMPEMDGLEASRRINAANPDGKRPRIVAMTANAMQGDREMCMEAGMDDYIAKPIRVERLVEALTDVPQRSKDP